MDTQTAPAKLSIVVKPDDYFGDMYMGYVYVGEELISTVASSFQFRALQKARKAAKLYSKYGICLSM
jgi:hypothetical protein